MVFSLMQEHAASVTRRCRSQASARGSCQEKGSACRSQLVDTASLTDTMRGAMRVEDDVQWRGATHQRDAGRRSVRNMASVSICAALAYAVCASGA